MRAPKGYIEISFDLGEAYIREDKLRDIGRINAVIFDCDGVLIDIRESYDKAIAEATRWIFETLTNQRIPEDLITSELIFLFRRSGGFNNDCDIVYGLLMFLLSEIPLRYLEELAKAIKLVRREEDVSKKIRIISEKMRINSIRDFSVSTAKLRVFISMLNDTGVISVDKALLCLTKIPEETYTTLKDFLYGSRRVSKDVIATVFEEIFCGPELFRNIYGVEPRFFHSLGTIENSRVIVRAETLSKLSSLIGGAKFGIASGSRYAPAKYVLGSLLELFNAEALVFLDDIENIEREYSSRGYLKVSLLKPNPYSLLKSAWRLEPFRTALFIGDSIEDALAAYKANRLDPRFMFAGVYAYTGAKEKALEEFLKFGCDIISPSVNEVPLIIETVRGMIS